MDNYMVEIWPVPAGRKIILKKISTGELVEELEVPGAGPDGLARAIKLANKLLEQNKKAASADTGADRINHQQPHYNTSDSKRRIPTWKIN